MELFQKNFLNIFMDDGKNIFGKEKFWNKICIAVKNFNSTKEIEKKLEIIATTLSRNFRFPLQLFESTPRKNPSSSHRKVLLLFELAFIFPELKIWANFSEQHSCLCLPYTIQFEAFFFWELFQQSSSSCTSSSVISETTFSTSIKNFWGSFFFFWNPLNLNPWNFSILSIFSVSPYKIWIKGIHNQEHDNNQANFFPN